MATSDALAVVLEFALTTAREDVEGIEPLAPLAVLPLLTTRLREVSGGHGGAAILFVMKTIGRSPSNFTFQHAPRSLLPGPTGCDADADFAAEARIRFGDLFTAAVKGTTYTHIRGVPAVSDVPSLVLRALVDEPIECEVGCPDLLSAPRPAQQLVGTLRVFLSVQSEASALASPGFVARVCRNRCCARLFGFSVATATRRGSVTDSEYLCERLNIVHAESCGAFVATAAAAGSASRHPGSEFCSAFCLESWLAALHARVPHASMRPFTTRVQHVQRGKAGLEDAAARTARSAFSLLAQLARRRAGSRASCSGSPVARCDVETALVLQSRVVNVATAIALAVHTALLEHVAPAPSDSRRLQQSRVADVRFTLRLGRLLAEGKLLHGEFFMMWARAATVFAKEIATCAMTTRAPPTALLTDPAAGAGGASDQPGVRTRLALSAPLRVFRESA